MASAEPQLLGSLSAEFARHFDPYIFSFFVVLYTLLEIIARLLAPYPTNVKNMKNPRKEEQLYYGEIVSIAHAVTSLGLVSYLWISIGLCLNQQNQARHYYLFAHQVAYFGVDFLCSKIFKYDDLMNDIHHVISFASVALIFFLKYGGPETLMGVFLAQVSNPFLQTRNTLRRLGYEQGSLYRWLEYAFVIIFLLFRLVLVLPVLLFVYSQHNCPMLIQISSSCIYSLSMIWNLQIMNKLWKAIKECLTHEGKNQLGPVGKQVDKFVKCIVFSAPGRSIVMIYTITAYFVMPVWYFILPRL